MILCLNKTPVISWVSILHIPNTALAIYTHFSTAYEALKGFGILQLLSVSSLKSFTSFNVESAGASEIRLAFARKQYDAMCEEKHAKGQTVPFKEGILVFDEVKVGVKVHYHAKTGRFIGLAMSGDELASLHDVHQTSRVIIAVKRPCMFFSISSGALHPTVTSLALTSPVQAQTNAKFIIATFFASMYFFHLYGFETKAKAIVCEGASSNLTTIKLLTSFGSGAYGRKPDESEGDIHEITTWFHNPYTNQKVYSLVCPSHQVKLCGTYSACIIASTRPLFMAGMSASPYKWTKWTN